MLINSYLSHYSKIDQLVTFLRTLLITGKIWINVNGREEIWNFFFLECVVFDLLLWLWIWGIECGIITWMHGITTQLYCCTTVRVQRSYDMWLYTDRSKYWNHCVVRTSYLDQNGSSVRFWIRVKKRFYILDSSPVHKERIKLVKPFVTGIICVAFTGGPVLENVSQYLLLTLKFPGTITSDLA